MSIETGKSELARLLADEANKVVALSGPWGTGKTHLWNEVREESEDAKIHSALYVSLFGVKDIGQLKLKVVQSVLPVAGASSTLTDGLGKAYRTGLEVLKKVNPAWGALDELALVVVPAALAGKFVVIDDIERKHSGLSIDEILGFVDEYTQRFGTRMLLILNSDKLSGDGDGGLWAAFREKVVGEELRFCPTPEEAFDIAVPEGASSFREAIKRAVEACGLTNIRLIRKVARLVDRLLGERANLPSEVQSRTIPSIVLLAAAHHDGIKDGPDLDFVANFNKDGAAVWERFRKERDGVEAKEPEPPTPAAWDLLMAKLGINSADQFEALVVAYLRDGRHEAEAIRKVVDAYCANASRLAANAAVQAFVEQFHWGVKRPDAELLAKAQRAVDLASRLDLYTVSGLHEQIRQLAGGQAVADRMLDDWLVRFEEDSANFEYGEPPFEQPLHPRIKEVIDRHRQARVDRGTLAEAVASLVANQGWGHREADVMKRATVDDFIDAMQSLEGKEFKLFLLKNLDILEQGSGLDQHLGDARHRFLEACRWLCRADPESRMAKLLETLFAKSRVAGLLEDGGLSMQAASAQPQ